MNKRRLVITGLLFAALTFLWGTGARAEGTRLATKKLFQDYRTEALDLDHFLLYSVYGIFDFEKVPETYKTRATGAESVPIHGTYIMKLVAKHWDELSEDIQRELDTYEERPTSGELPSTRSTDHFIIHYTTADGVDKTTTAYVDTVETVCEESYDKIVTDMGYDPAPPDGSAGGDEKYDIYIAGLDETQLGVTINESAVSGAPNRPRDEITYFVLNNSLNTDEIKTTLSHEYFHAVKGAYDWWDSSGEGEYWWFDEATSTWIMEIVYPDIDDYVTYIDGNNYDWLSVPELTLEENEITGDTNTNPDLRWYGSAIFAFFLAEKYGTTIIREIWTKLIPETVEGIDGVEDELVENHSTTLADAMSEFHVWNYYTGDVVVDTDTYYDEGDQYGEVFISAEHETYPVTTQTPSSRLPDHLGANYIEFTPAEAGPKNLVISFDGKDTTDWKIRVVKVNPSGDDEVVEMTLDGDEKGTVTVNNFGTSSTYRQVALIATVTSRSGDDNTYTYSALTSSADTDWTYMVYMNGDSSTTEQEACEELEAMGVVGSSSGDVNIVVQLDRASGGYSGFGNWTGARRFLLAQGDDPASTPVSDLGAVNMGDSITLSGFVTWAAANYPADKYALVVWDRAVSGFPTDAVVTDSTSADSMTFTELKTALVASASALGQDIDVLALDASMMGYLETAYQVKDSAGVLVYSQENLPTGGIPNNDVLTALKLAPTSTAANLGQGFVTAFGNEHSAIGTHTLAALDSTQMAATKTAFDSLVSELNSNIAQEKTDYTGAWVATERFDNGTSTLSRVALDLDNLSESLRGTVSSASLITACQNLETALANLVSNETHGASYSAANGVSIYFPYAPTDKDSGYDSRTSLAADTDWDLFLTTYFTDDTHEDNDTRLTAASVSDGSQTSLSCYDDDWYAVSRSAGEGISVHIAFTHNDRGNLNLHFYDTDGTTILKSSTTSTDDETVNHTSLPGTGTYYIKVVGASASDVNSYDMGIGDPFSMESAATVDRTTIDVTFSETLNSGTVSAADFSVSDETITAVSVDGSTVRLTVTPVLDTEAAPGVSLVNEVVSTNGTSLSSAGPLTPADGIKPEVVSVDVTSGRHLSVTFSETMSATGLTTITNYSQSGGSGDQQTSNPSSVDISANPVVVLIYPYRTFKPENSVSLTASTVLADAAAGANSLNASVNSASDSSVDADTGAPDMSSAATSSTTSLIVQFTEDLADSTVDTNGSDFQVGSGSYTVTAASENSGVVTLTLNGGTPLAADAQPTVSLVGEVTDLVGNPLSSADPVTASDGIEPGVESIDVISGSRVTVTFTETLSTTGLSTVGNYTQTGASGAQKTANPTSVDTNDNPEIILEFPYQTFMSGDGITLTVAGLTDENDNSLDSGATSGSESPASGGEADFTAPTYDAAITGDLSAGQSSVLDKIVVSFSENIDSTTVSTADFQVTSPAVTVSTVTVSGSDVTLALESSLTSGQTPLVTITGDLMADEKGNYLNTATLARTSSDGIIPDMTAAITASTTTIVVTFSEDLDAGTVATTDFTVADNTVTAANELAPGVITLTLQTPIAGADTPVVTLVSGVDDLRGNTNASDGPLIPSDGIAPDVSSIDVVSTIRVSVVFSETMAAGSGDTALDRPENYTQTGGTGVTANPASVDTTANPTVVLSYPAATFQGTDNVTVTVQNVLDGGGNALSGDNANENPAEDGVGDDFNAPDLTAAVTGDSASGDSGSADRIHLTFDDSLDAATVSITDFQVTDPVRSVTAIESLAGATLVLVLDSSLASDDTPTVSIAGDGVSDDTGNPTTSGSVTASDGLGPDITSAMTVDRTTIDVTFTEDLDAVTVAAADFQVSAHTVTGATETSASIVQLTLGENMNTGEAPQVTLAVSGEIDDASSNTLTPAFASTVTPGDGIAPEVASIDVLSATWVEITFSETMGTGSGSTALDAVANYVQTGGTGASATANPTTVDTSGNPTVLIQYAGPTFVVNDSVTVTVSNVIDAAPLGSTINASANSGTENPVVADTTPPAIDTATTKTTTSIEVEFSESLDSATVDADGSDFQVDGGAYTVTAASAVAELVTLTLDGTTPLDDADTPDVELVDEVTDVVGNATASDGPEIAADGIPPRLTGLNITNGTSSVLTFSEILGNGAGTIGNYSQSGSSGAQAQTYPTSVDTSGNPVIVVVYPYQTFVTGDTVTLTATLLEDTAGNTVDDSSDKTEAATVTVDTDAPGLQSAVTLTTSTVDVTFTENLLAASVDGDGSDFQIDGVVASAASLSGSVVTLTASIAFSRSATPAVSITGDGVTDLDGNPITSGSVTAADGVNPPAASSLLAAVADSSLDLTWTNPGEDFSGTVILMKASSPPTGSPSDGITYSADDTIGDGTVVFAASGDYSSTPFSDTALTNGTTYYYTAFSYDAAKNYATSAASASGTPVDLTAPTFAGLAQAQDAGTTGAVDLSWSAAVEPASPQGSPPVTYYIYRSESSGFTPAPGNLIHSAEGITGYQDTGLTVGTPYYYIVRAEDARANRDTNTVERSATPTDQEAPLITSGPTVSGIGNETATILWETSEEADSTVEYGTTTGYGQSVTSASMTTSHSVALTGLNEATLYHFRVLSSDVYGNGPVSSTDNSFYSNRPPAITVNEPDAGDVWTGTQNITWTATDADEQTLTMSIQYSTDGASWTDLPDPDDDGQGQSVNDGTYSWDTTAFTDGKSYYLQIGGTDGLKTTWEDLDGTFAIENVQTVPDLTLTYPVGGEKVGQTVTVAWNTDDQDAGESRTVIVEYSTDNAVWRPIVSGIPDTGTYGWKSTSVPDGTSYYIRVSVNDNRASAVSGGTVPGEDSDSTPAAFEVDNTPPEFVAVLEVTILANSVVKLDWEESSSPDIERYNIYYDYGTGIIDYSSPIDWVPAGTTTWRSDAVAAKARVKPMAGSVDKYAVRAQDEAGNEEGNTSAQAMADATNPEIENLSVSEFESGKPRLAFKLTDTGSGIDVSSIEVKLGPEGGAASVIAHRYNPTTQTVVAEPSSNLSSGEYTVTVTVKDRAENESETFQTTFTVYTSFAMKKVFSYPNPATNGDDVTFRYTLTGSADWVEIRVYDKADRLLLVIPGDTDGDINEVVWDATYDDGDSVRFGTYIYKIIARNYDGHRAEVRGKLTILP